ncbi:MAG TPA: PEP-CTERM sorting domain-containing protein [Fimbriimonas sp.]|nr:PEP-CTERM sorting domain-containing protein [Fimbriimonas sp.]
MRKISVLALGMIAAASHGFIDVNFDSLVNADLTNLTGGWGYPQNGGNVTISGIDHRIALTSGGKSGGMFFNDQTKTIAVGEFGIHEVYTIINSGQGAFGQLNGIIEIHGSGGLLQTVSLIQGDNIRDHYNGNYNNTATNINGSLGYASGVRFDQQKIVLDPAFHTATLTEIRFIGQNNFGNNGSPMLQSLTLNTVPEPASMLILAAGAGALLRRRSKKSATV